MKILISVLAISLFIFTSITETKADPPPWAPAHGYRYKHKDGVELVLDTGGGFYFVIDFPNIFYSNNHFYKRKKNSWQSSVSFNGPWTDIKSKNLPPGLRKKYN